MSAIVFWVTVFLFASSYDGAAQTGASNPAPKRESSSSATETASAKPPEPDKAGAKSPAPAVSKADTAAVRKPAALPDSSAGGPEAGTTEAAAGDSAKAEENPLAYTRPVFIYEPGGKRDPFNSLVPKEIKDEKKIKGLFNYEKAVLKGIVHTDTDAYALAVDGDNYAHVLRKDDRVFGGYVTDITDDSVYLHIVKYGRAMSIILRMETAKQTVKSSDEGVNVVKRPGINLSFEPGQSSGNILTVEDVVVPSIETRTVEEVWFGPDSGENGPADSSGACMLISPPDSSVILLPHVFRWTKAEGDSLYTLVFSEDREFASQLVVKEGLTGTTYLLESDPGLKPGSLYYWKIIALKRTGKWVNSRNHLSIRITESSDRGVNDEKK